ncbi:MAG: metallophosphoesterase family protein, partial [Oscillospiraceae bacterium]|nr:metallophosphoesterase family protein [Oscillospiraceae bacterium]
MVIKARHGKRALALLLLVVLVLGTATAAFGYESGPGEHVEYAIGPNGHEGASLFASRSIAGAGNYRNLNLTPGGTVEEMRFTWHSQSTTGGIRVYPAGGDTPVQVAVSTTQTLNTRSISSTWFPAWASTPDYTVHQVTITGLHPGTEYEYVVTGAGFESSRKEFRTGGDDSFRFLIGGDPQIGVGVQNAALDRAGWVNTMSVAAAQVPDAGFFLSVGDQIHTNTNNMTRSQYMYDILLTPSEFHNIPLMPVVGNHEAGTTNSNGILWHRHYNTSNPTGSGTVLDNARRHGTQPIQFDYYVVWGNMLIIALDSNTRTWGGGRLGWFESVIEDNPYVDWRVVTFHHPPYSVYRATTDGAKNQIISNWIPEFQRLGIDAVLSGHCHSYSRSHQMYSNVPQLNQDWLDGAGQIQSTPTNAVLDPSGIVYIAFNSASGSGYYNVTAMAGRHYIAAYNQNFHRNFSVVDVTPYTFSVATYQVNADSSTTLVDVYTIVQRDADGNVPAEVLNSGLRQMDDSQMGTFLRGVTTPISELPLNTTLDAIEGLLPARIAIETDIRSNSVREPLAGNIAAIRNPGGAYGVNVRPMFADVTWNMDSITPEFNPAPTSQQTYTIFGTVANPPAGVGGFTPPMTVSIDVSVGFEPQRPFDGYISYFGARYRFFGRSNSAFLYDAFNPDVFATWPGGGANPAGQPTPIGFGSPRSGTGLTLATVIPTTGGSAGRSANPGNPSSGNPVHTFTYFARTFYLPEHFCLENIGSVHGAHRLDDVLVLFINGIEVYRANTATNASNNIRIGHPVNWGVFVGQNTDAQHRTFHINYDFDHRNMGVPTQAAATMMHDAASRTNFDLALRHGQNVLTAVVGNNSATSSDLWFDLELFVELDTCGCVSVPPVVDLSALNELISNAQSRT